MGTPLKQTLKTNADPLKGSTGDSTKNSFFFQPGSHLKKAPFFQPRLVIGNSNDVHEKEADAVAENVVAKADHTALKTPPKISTVVARSASVQRVDEENGAIQRQAFNDQEPLSNTPDIVDDVLQTQGHALDRETRSAMENNFGYDFSQVKIHTGQRAAQSAQSINALAYTSGNSIVFNQGQFAPHTTSGQKLLAHELTHVIQQSGGLHAKHQEESTISSMKPSIQRTSEDEIPITTNLGNGFTFQQWINHGQALLTYREERWLIFKWTGGLIERRMSVGVGHVATTNTTVLAFSAAFPVTVLLNSAAERYAAGIAGGTLNISYQFNFPGNCERYENNRVVETTTARDTPQKHIEGAPMPAVTEGGAIGSVEDYGLHRTLPIAPPLEDYSSRVWSFRTREAFNQFARQNASNNWACVVLPDGRFIAYELTRETIHRFARNVRNGRYHQSFTDQFNGSVSTVFIHGHQLSSLEDLRNLYFDNVADAALGIGTGTGMDGLPIVECAVYEMGDGSYGRKPLSHDEAVSMWQTLSAMESAAVHRYEVEPGHIFKELNVRGRSRFHRIDQRYFTGRKAYYTFIATTRAAGNEPNITAANEDEWYYMTTEADRPGIDTSFRDSLSQNETIATNLQEEIYRQVESAGQLAAIQRLRDSHKYLEKLATDRDTLNGFITEFHTLTLVERLQALTTIGVVRHPEGISSSVTDVENSWYDGIVSVLSDANEATKVVLGLNPFVYRQLELHARITANGIQQMINSLESRNVIAIRAEGDVGIQARNIAYREMGFTRLQGNTFPHTAEVDQSFPGPMSGLSENFGSIAEQLYANRIVRMTNEERIMHFAGLTASVLGSAALIIFSGGVGATGAELLFAEGTAGFFATEATVGGLTLTILNEGVAQISGHGEIRANDVSGSIARIGISAASNILSFAVFKELNSTFGAFGSAVAGGGNIIAGSTKAFVAGSIRLGSLFFASVAWDVFKSAINNERGPDDHELASIFYKNALMLLTLEVGGILARPLMTQSGIWARGRRLGPENLQRIDSLTSDLTTLQEDVASYAENQAGKSVADLITRQQQMLTRQHDVVNRLRESVRGTGDAEVIERMAIEELLRIDQALAMIRDVQFAAATKMRSTGTGDNDFYYQEGTVDKIREHFGADNVHGPDAEGVVTVTQGERTITFRPAPVVETATSTSPVTGAVRGDVYDLTGSQTLRTHAAARNQKLSITHLFRFLTHAENVTDRKIVVNDTLRSRMNGSELSWPGEKAPFYNLAVKMPDGRSVIVEVRIKYSDHDTWGVYNGQNHPGRHGDDTGPATYTLVYSDGKLEAFIDVNPDIQITTQRLSNDLEKVVGHELDEISDITRQIFSSSTVDQRVVNTILNREADAVVFRPGSTAPPASVTSHDKATAAQLFAHFEEINSVELRKNELTAQQFRESVAVADARFTRMLASMGLTGQSTFAEVSRLRDALEISGQNDPAFLNRVESQWRSLVTSRALTASPVENPLPNETRIITPKLIEHISFPDPIENNNEYDFLNSGIDGGHETSNLEALNSNVKVPFYVVRESTISYPPGGSAHRYHQYRYKGSADTKLDATPPIQAPGGPTATPIPGVHFDASLWQLSNRPKTAVDDLNAFLPEAEKAFAEYFKNNEPDMVRELQEIENAKNDPTADAATKARKVEIVGRLFEVTFNGNHYMGYYNYDRSNLSLNSIFIDAKKMP